MSVQGTRRDTRADACACRNLIRADRALVQRPQPSWDDLDLYDYWCALLKEAGVRHIRLHDGRHTAATLLLSEGIHPRVVMELLGHSQMRTTTDTYSHVMPALAQEAAERMAQALWDSKPE